MTGNSNFFQNVNYASFHEDGRSERRALELNSTDRVLCITGSGARPLELLLDGPKEIVSIDWNPAQSYLLELKIVVIRKLDYEQGLEFLGMLPSSRRKSTYAEIRDELTKEARTFWDRRSAAIANGFFFAGRWERFLRRASWAARWTRRDLVSQLTNARDVAEQHEIWRKQWDNRWWRTFLRLATNRTFVRWVLREPGLDFVPTDVSISEFIRERFEQASANFLFRESPWMWALMKGRVDVDGPLPEHLLPENFERLRNRIDAITIETDSLNNYLSGEHPPIDAFSVSDFGSYCDQQTHDQIWRAMLKNSNTGARFCERRFLVSYPFADEVGSQLLMDNELADTLDKEDRSVVYSFLVAQRAK